MAHEPSSWILQAVQDATGDGGQSASDWQRGAEEED